MIAVTIAQWVIFTTGSQLRREGHDPMAIRLALLLLLSPALAPAQGDLSKLLSQGLDAALKSLVDRVL